MLTPCPSMRTPKMLPPSRASTLPMTHSTGVSSLIVKEHIEPVRAQSYRFGQTASSAPDRRGPSLSNSLALRNGPQSGVDG